MLREFARLQAAGLRIGEADFTEMENWLTPLMADDSPWRYSARELLGLAAFKAGKTTEARTILTPLLVDQATPQSITERAQIVMAEIAAGEIAKKAASDRRRTAAPSPDYGAAGYAHAGNGAAGQKGLSGGHMRGGTRRSSLIGAGLCLARAACRLRR